jgi:HAD superfamily hydrolase (TIGR01549 family)
MGGGLRLPPLLLAASLTPDRDVKIVIFDFDGTIADTFDAVLRITSKLAVELGYKPPTPEEVQRLRNLDSREIIKQSKIPLFRLPFLLKRLKTELRQEIKKLKPIPGMSDTLIQLRQRDHLLGIVTSNSQDNVKAFLATHGLDQLFSFIYSGTTLFGKGRVINRLLKQHNLDYHRVVYVGDETRDIEAAQNIQIRVVAVTWGFNSEEALLNQNPDFLIHRPLELIDVIETLM